MEYPHLIEPSHDGYDLKAWLTAHPTDVDRILAGTGAILFRNFNVNGPGDFLDLVKVPLGELLQYIEGASPRVPLGGGIYTSTEYSPELSVSMHNELSYSHQWPTRLAFYCRHPASTGGQTPIADSRKVLRRVASAISKIPAQVEYLRRMPRGRGPGVDWPTVFATEDRRSVETYMHSANIQYQWLDDDGLGTRQVRPTAIEHPVTYEDVWFNQMHQWHPSNAGEDTEEMLRAVFGDELPMDVRLPGGTDIGRDLLKAVRDAYEHETVLFDWKAGDVLLIDNMLAAHGRRPFTGHREVLVAMGVATGLGRVRQVEFNA